MLVMLTSFLLPHAAPAREFLVYFGTYTGPKSQGIYVSRFDARTGRLSAPELAAETQNPSFLAVHPNRRQLYAVGEIGDFAGKRTGAVSAFAIDPRTGGLTLLNQQSSGGQGPCHLSLDTKGRFLLVANYGGGSVASLPVRPDGSLAEAVSIIQHAGSSVNPKRQAGPHAHFIAMDPANRFALACDLGLDKLLVYRLDAKNGELIPNDPPFAVVAPGAGPRQLAFSRDAKFVFVLNELSSSLTTFAYVARRGMLTELQTLSTLPGEFAGNNSCAEVEMHPSGRFLYASNRGHDSIAVFAVEKATGRLTLAEHQPTRGKTPRHFAIDPTGRWLLAENQGDNNVVVFEVDKKKGKLRPTGQVVEVGSPVCAVFVPAR
ncbi:MAG: lactonase family protein [Verrucomicrobiae bacterium]|nr:lactonase family protein [Verrucomicrobiae bacterium]